VWRSGSPAPRRVQRQAYEQEFEYDLGVPVSGGNGGLMEPITSRRVAPPPPQQMRVSGPAPRRSPPPPSSFLARRSPSPPSTSSHSSPSHASRPLTRTPSPPTPTSLPHHKSPAQLQAEKDTRAKLVAGILLNRIHVQRKQGGMGRRVPSPVGGGRVYVPSGLRREVCVAA
jgi:hypothetical protein